MGHPAAGKVETPGNGNYNVGIPRQGAQTWLLWVDTLKGQSPTPNSQTTLINKYKGNTFPREPVSLPWPLTSLSGRFLQPRGLSSAPAPQQRACKGDPAGLAQHLARPGQGAGAGAPNRVPQGDTGRGRRASSRPVVLRAPQHPVTHCQVTRSLSGSRCARSDCTLLT